LTLSLDAAAVTDVGRVRDGNEDAFLVDDRLHLFAVADGMGGHRAGEVASATALEALRAAVAAGRPLDEALELANDAVYEKSTDDPSMAGMGTTLTAGMAVENDLFLIGHVGDSRAYLVRGPEMEQVTDDHSLVEELVRDGKLTPEQAAVHPQRSIITRALGVADGVEIDLYPVVLEPGDRIVLCSDGLSSMVRDPVIARIVRREPEPTRAAEALVDAANEAGGEDNITAVVVYARDAGGEAPSGALPGADRGTDRGPGGGGPATDDPSLPPGPGPDGADRPGVADRTDDAERPGGAYGSGDDLAAAVDAAAGPGSAGAPGGPRPGGWRRAGRLARFALPVLLIVGVAVAAVGLYARRFSFFVKYDASGHVTVYRGVPGGLFLWSPTVEERTGLRERALTPSARQDVADVRRFSSAGDARAYVDRLRDDARDRAAATSTTTTAPATTSTTAGPSVGPAVAPDAGTATGPTGVPAAAIAPAAR